MAGVGVKDFGVAVLVFDVKAFDRQEIVPFQIRVDGKSDEFSTLSDFPGGGKSGAGNTGRVDSGQPKADFLGNGQRQLIESKTADNGNYFMSLPTTRLPARGLGKSAKIRW